jgi:hypothetical protein
MIILERVKGINPAPSFYLPTMGDGKDKPLLCSIQNKKVHHLQHLDFVRFMGPK